MRKTPPRAYELNNLRFFGLVQAYIFKFEVFCATDLERQNKLDLLNLSRGKKISALCKGTLFLTISAF